MPETQTREIKEAPSAARREATAAKGREGPLSARELELTHAYWRACNYLAG